MSRTRTPPDEAFRQPTDPNIVKPHLTVPVSQYFVDNWQWRLGRTATLLILFLRRRALPEKEGEAYKTAVDIEYWELSRAVGVSASAIRRELEGNPWLHLFVRVESQFVANRKGPSQTGNLYHIRMDDPVTPEDEERI